MILEILLAVFLILVFSLIIYCRWNYGKLESLGIPVVKPFFIFGSNYKEPYIYVQQEDIRRQKEYGMVYGAYDGRYPTVYISDPAIIRVITTVDFDYFQNHGWIFGGSGPDSVLGNVLDLLKDEQWKIVRSALTPIFTGSKLKQMSKIVHQFSEDYAEILLKSNQLEKVHFKEFAAPLILEAIAKCFCGIDIPNPRDPQNMFVNKMKQALLHDVEPFDLSIMITRIFPFLLNLMPAFPEDGIDFFIQAVRDILKQREAGGSVAEYADAASALVDMMKKVRTDEKYKRLGIKENVVIAQAWEFFLAAYAGLRDTFEFLMCELAFNKDCQEKIHAEIDNCKAYTEELPYLQASIMEVLRLHSAFSRPERLCGKDWEHDGLRIPKGVQVVFPTSALHMNPDLYPEPEKFDPERFMPGVQRDQFAFFAFGQGPRGCIGQRFALQMLKVMAVSFLKRFNVEKRSDTKIEFKKGGAFIAGFSPIYVDLVKRQ